MSYAAATIPRMLPAPRKDFASPTPRLTSRVRLRRAWVAAAKTIAEHQNETDWVQRKNCAGFDSNQDVIVVEQIAIGAVRTRLTNVKCSASIARGLRPTRRILNEAAYGRRCYLDARHRDVWLLGR